MVLHRPCSPRRRDLIQTSAIVVPHGWGWLFLAPLLGGACQEIPDGGAAGASEGGGVAGGADAGTVLEVPVDGDTYVDLDSMAVVEPSAPWDLSFRGLDVFTNGGISGPGEGSAFGPLPTSVLLDDEVPEVPFLVSDFAGGPFLDWYAYDDVSHSLYSRYHVYGVRRGSERYKVQILSYYGEALGAPVAALYQVLLSRLDLPSEPVLLADVDGTAGGLAPRPDDPSGCIRLATGERLVLTPLAAASSPDWDLCFRRDAISVNGGASGSAGVDAVDLTGPPSSDETLDEVMARSADSERTAFDAVSAEMLASPALHYTSDGPASAFTGAWLAKGTTPLTPVSAAWLVAAADGETPFVIAFEALEGDGTTELGVVQLRVKRLAGSLP